MFHSSHTFFLSTRIAYTWLPLLERERKKERKERKRKKGKREKEKEKGENFLRSIRRAIKKTINTSSPLIPWLFFFLSLFLLFWNPHIRDTNSMLVTFSDSSNWMQFLEAKIWKGRETEREREGEKLRERERSWERRMLVWWCLSRWTDVFLSPCSCPVS